MYGYFIKNGFEGRRNTSEVYAFLETRGFTFQDYIHEGEQVCRYIYLNGQLTGECWCNYREELEHDTLVYIEDNDLMSLCDANL